MKRLFTQLLALMAFVSANALEVGEYMYSNTNKFKVTGQNIVVNGNFANLFEDGWTNEEGGAVDGAVWETTTTEDGRTVVNSASQTSEATKALANVWELQNGLYVVSYWAKAASGSIVTTTTAGQNNYVNFFASTDGTTNSRAISGAESIGTDWTQVVDTIFVNVEKEFLVFNASGIPSGTMFTDFEIYPVIEVYDTRIVDRLIKYAEDLLAEPDLVNGKDDFGGIVEMMKGMVENPSQSEDADAMQALIDNFNEEFNNYMNLNGGNMNAGDWTTVKSQGFNKLKNTTLVGSWAVVGDRWGFSANDASLERPANDGYVASAGIQQTFDLGEKGIKVENAAWAPGKYFFAIEAQEVAASAKSSPYGADHTKLFIGPKLYIGSDTLVMRPATEAELAAANPNFRYAETPDTLNGYYWKRYYMIGEVKAGETVRAGFIFPGYDDKRGGRASLRNPEFRMLGKTELQLKYEQAVKEVITQQIELKARLDNYQNDVAEYIWSKDSVDRAVANAQPVYDNSLTIVNPVDSTCTLPVSEESLEQLGAYASNVNNATGLVKELMLQVNELGRAKNYVINQNAIQESLKNTIAEGQAVLDDPLNAGGDAGKRAELQSAVSAAQSLIDNISATNQYDEFQAAIDAIEAAIVAFKITAAARNNPADIALVNADFSANSGNITTTTPFTNNGWNYTPAGTFKQWQYGGPTDAWEGSKYSNQWRGSTVTLGGKVQQTVTLTDPGVYEYRAMAYAHNDNLGYLQASAEYVLDEEGVQIDTIYTNMPARLFFGPDGLPDSIRVTKSIAPGANSSAVANRPWRNINGFTPWHYSVFFVKKNAEPVTVELGFEVDALEVGKGLNGFGFGANHVYFVGDEAKYTAATKADLTAEVAKAKAVVAAAADNAEVAFLVVKLNRYIANAEAATTIKDMQNAYLSLLEVEGLINGVIGDVEGIAATFAQPVEAVKGVYTISGLKVGNSVDNLKAGLYIINGKKYVVK